MAQTQAAAEYWAAVAEQRDAWVVGGCGTEEPFRTREGRTILRVYNPGRSEHGWLDMGTDTVIPDLDLWGRSAAI